MSIKTESESEPPTEEDWYTMPSPIKGTKRQKFKLRASADLPEREWKAEFTASGVSFSSGTKKHALRWRPLLGHMSLFPSKMTAPEDVSTRAFLVELKAPDRNLESVEYLIEFSKKGVLVRERGLRVSNGGAYWPWRTLLNVAIVGI